MSKVIFALFFFFISFQVFGQSKKDQVLVYGDSEIAWAAAIQSSKSGVNTLWIRNNKIVGDRFKGEDRIRIQDNDGLDAGLWAEVLQRVSRSTVLNDSILNRTKRDLNPRLVQNAFSSFIDSSTMLTVIYNVQVKSIKKSGDRWKVYLSNNRDLKVNAIVDGSDDERLVKLLEKEDLSKSYIERSDSIASNIYEHTLFRTGLVVTDKIGKPAQITASAFLNTPASNFFVINRYSWLQTLSGSDQNIALSIQSGQAIGASAAYCAFFKTTTDKINIRTLQGELLAYHGMLMPFQDIPIQDIHYGEIQRIGATGLLKGEYFENGGNIQFQFNPEDRISSKEIEPIMLQLYTRSQLWFREKDIDSLTLEDLLDLIKFTALKGNEINAEVERGWHNRFKFDGEYDPRCYLTKRQIAVLIDYYLKPFNVKVDEKGKFKY